MRTMGRVKSREKDISCIKLIRLRIQHDYLECEGGYNGSDVRIEQVEDAISLKRNWYENHN